MSDFINTIEILGDEVTMDAIIEGTITEFKDNTLTEIGPYAFSGCTALTIVDLPKVATVSEATFNECAALESINLPKLTSYNGGYIFSNCETLKKISLPSLSVAIGHYLFYRCSNLQVVEFFHPLEFGGWNTQQTFRDCKALVALVLRTTEDLCILGAYSSISTTPIASGTGYIYVPRDLVDSYKAATNWSTYADQFRVLEDYTVDGTITGKLDETKI